MQHYFRLLNVVAGVIVLGAMFLGGGGSVQAAHRQPSALGRVSLPPTQATALPSALDYFKRYMHYQLGNFDDDGVTDFAVWKPGSAEGKQGNGWQICYSSDLPDKLLQTDGTDPGGKSVNTQCRRTTPIEGRIPRHRQTLGVEGDWPVPGDYIGDSSTDYAVWRPTSSTWYICENTADPASPKEDNTCDENNKDEVKQIQFGAPGDIPVPGNYEGSAAGSKSDLAVYNPKTGDWTVCFISKLPDPLPAKTNCNGATRTQKLGGLAPQAEDFPVPGHYNTAQALDFAVFRPSEGTWYICSSTDKAGNPRESNTCQQPGQTYTEKPYETWAATFPKFKKPEAGDIPVPGEYQAGASTAFTIWRPTTKTFYELDPASSPDSVNPKPHEVVWGISANDIPVTGYFKDSSENYAVSVYAVYHTENYENGGIWYVRCDAKTTACPDGEIDEGWGASNFIPV